MYIPAPPPAVIDVGGVTAPTQPTQVSEPIMPAVTENMDCAQYHCINGACTDYTACYDASMNAKATERVSSTEVTNGFMVTYVTLLRMKCLLNIIGMEGDQAAEIDACSERYRIGSPLVDTALLTPTILPYPVREPCERLDIPSGCVQVTVARRGAMGNAQARNLFR